MEVEIKKQRSEIVTFFIIFTVIVFIFGLLAWGFITTFFRGDPPAYEAVTFNNLKAVRSAIRLYQLKAGELPSADLNELYNVSFKDGSVEKTILEDGMLPPELITSHNQSMQGNPPNRKVVNKPDNTGGWVYDPATGTVKVNYNKKLDDNWDKYEGENPYKDW